MAPVLHEAGEKITKACNDESSWGFYSTEKSRHGGAVVALTHEAQLDNGRAQRILRNVEKGKVR